MTNTNANERNRNQVRASYYPPGILGVYLRIIGGAVIIHYCIARYYFYHMLNGSLSMRSQKILFPVILIPQSVREAIAWNPWVVIYFGPFNEIIVASILGVVLAVIELCRRAVKRRWA